MRFKDPMNNMDRDAVRVVHVPRSDGRTFICGRRTLAVMWGAQDVAAGKLPTCVACVAGVCMIPRAT